MINFEYNVINWSLSQQYNGITDWAFEKGCPMIRNNGSPFRFVRNAEALEWTMRRVPTLYFQESVYMDIIACKDEKLLLHLFNAPNIILPSRDTFLDKLLFAAIKSGHLDSVRVIVQLGQYTVALERKMINMAAEFGRAHIVAWMLSECISSPLSLESRKSLMEDVLFHAIKGGHSNIIEGLIEGGAIKLSSEVSSVKTLGLGFFGTTDRQNALTAPEEETNVRIFIDLIWHTTCLAVTDTYEPVYIIRPELTRFMDTSNLNQFFIEKACTTGLLNQICYIKSQIDYDCMVLLNSECVVNGHYDIVKWIFANGLYRNSTVMETLAKTCQDTQILQWALDAGIPWSPECFAHSLFNKVSRNWSIDQGLGSPDLTGLFPRWKLLIIDGFVHMIKTEPIDNVYTLVDAPGAPEYNRMLLCNLLFMAAVKTGRRDIMEKYGYRNFEATDCLKLHERLARYTIHRPQPGVLEYLQEFHIGLKPEVLCHQAIINGNLPLLRRQVVGHDGYRLKKRDIMTACCCISHKMSVSEEAPYFHPMIVKWILSVTDISTKYKWVSKVLNKLTCGGTIDDGQRSHISHSMLSERWAIKQWLINYCYLGGMAKITFNDSQAERIARDEPSRFMTKLFSPRIAHIALELDQDDQASASNGDSSDDDGPGPHYSPISVDSAEFAQSYEESAEDTEVDSD
jgi:hypothetical protein